MAFRSSLLAVGLIALTVPSAALAQSSNTLGNGAASASAKKYCIQYERDTGSRLNRVECKTKAEWARQGVQVDQLMKK